MMTTTVTALNPMSNMIIQMIIEKIDTAYVRTVDDSEALRMVMMIMMMMMTMTE